MPTSLIWAVGAIPSLLPSLNKNDDWSSQTWRGVAVRGVGSKN